MKALTLLVQLLFSASLMAQQVVVESHTGTSKEATRSKARKAIFEQAVEEISNKYILEIVGEEKAKRNKNLIRNKIIKNSKKYILTSTTGALENKKGTFTMPVTLKMSLTNLNKLLLDEGLLYKIEGQPSVIPVVGFTDRVNSKAYNWWVHTNRRGFLQSRAREMHQEIKNQLWNFGFFGLDPATRGFGAGLPTIYQLENPQKEDILFIGEFFGASIAVRGGVRYRAHRKISNTYVIDIKFQALQVGEWSGHCRSHSQL